MGENGEQVGPRGVNTVVNDQISFIRDIGTGGLLTLGFEAVLAAVSSGVTQ